MAELKAETDRLDAEKKELQETIKNLQLQLKQAGEDYSEKKELEKKFESWSGVRILKASEKICKVALPFVVKGKDCEEYSIGFKKLGSYWTVDYYCMPPCMKLIPQRVSQERIDSIHKLSCMIRKLQLEADLFIRRKEQFVQAQTLSSSTIRIFPSISTTSVLLEFHVDDNGGESDLSYVSVYLNYLLDRFLPEEPIYKFQGGDKESHQEFKEQLKTLVCMPLKEAILKAFKGDLEPSDSEVEETSSANAPLSGVKGNLKEGPVLAEGLLSTQPSPPPSPPPAKSAVLVAAPVVKRGGTRGRGRPRGRGRGPRGGK